MPQPLVRVSLVYLALPCMVFLLGMVMWSVAIPCACLILLALALEIRNAPDQLSDWKLWTVSLVGALAVAASAGFFSGATTSDWYKHWALAHELATRAWPVSLELNGEERHLRFYVGAYLIPAIIHKALPWINASTALCFWFLVGFWLVMRTVGSLGRTWFSATVALVLFFALGGADAFATKLLRAANDMAPVPWLGIHFDAWANPALYLPLEFSSMLTDLIWVPHQSIATFLAAALLVLGAGPVGLGASALGFGLLSLWSPYGMIGLLPVMLFKAWVAREELRQWRSWVSIGAGVAFTVIVIAYLSTQLPAAGACFSCIPERFGQLHDYAIFLLVELIVFALILRNRLVREPLCLVALVTLLVIPLLHSETPDLVMRGSMGPIFVLCLRCIQVLLIRPQQASVRVVHVVAFALSMPTTASEVVYVAQAGAAHRALADRDPLHASWTRNFATRRSYTAAEFLDACGWRFEGQYFSRGTPHLIRSDK